MGYATSTEARHDMVWVGAEAHARHSFSLNSVNIQRLRLRAMSMLGTLSLVSSARHSGSCRHATLLVEEMMKGDNDHVADMGPLGDDAAQQPLKLRTPTLTPTNEPEEALEGIPQSSEPMVVSSTEDETPREQERKDRKDADACEDCLALAALDLSNNWLVGAIPSSLTSCQRLVKLNLRHNQVTGEIPKALAMMPAMAILDLSSNSLTGGIPENFGSSPALETLNLSYNSLMGLVPRNDILCSINPNELAGNVGLCGGVLPPCFGSRDTGVVARAARGSARLRHVALV
ncbi:unnamed protein product [Miscanthus lutarioriparius]|uniref:Uncharacterized protein n=1 Tax=Miscanthus lutarioriparius TaxID=422564 RepID=A0A811MYL3_9POAL|nr:unnamed protein product [Miscanthus lutarioriparius]